MFISLVKLINFYLKDFCKSYYYNFNLTLIKNTKKIVYIFEEFTSSYTFSAVFILKVSPIYDFNSPFYGELKSSTV